MATAENMWPPSDARLLTLFSRERSEDAFRMLVERHAGLVYGICRRGLAGDAELAKEAAQAVFIVLARKARKLRKRRTLSSWLLRTSNTVVKTVRRRQARRQRQEEKAADAAAPVGALLRRTA
ncbi:MAG: hypothetical protein JXR37_03000 [Kiritimatiellae bacterium]|nr:hypothetical protein [Kiritimatiellia bacterium]